MSLESLFRGAVEALRERDVSFAVAGGLAADLYRREPRLTMDVDLAIVMPSRELSTAKDVLASLGLSPGVAREADLAGGPMFAIRRKSTRPCMVVGRREGAPAGEGVDILLSSIPWVTDATRRAQDNPVDFGFGPVPALTVEDIILSKLYALISARLRAKDLDDLQSIYEAEVEVDVAYLAGQMRRFKIVVPRAAEPFLDDTILKISRDIVRSARSK
jgi:hypothetical protein